MYDEFIKINRIEIINRISNSIYKGNVITIEMLSEELIDIVINKNYNYMSSFSYPTKTDKQKLLNFLRAEIIKAHIRGELSNNLFNYLDESDWETQFRNRLISKVEKCKDNKEIYNAVCELTNSQKNRIEKKFSIPNPEYCRFLLIQCDIASRLDISKYVAKKIRSYKQGSKTILKNLYFELGALEDRYIAFDYADYIENLFGYGFKSRLKLMNEIAYVNKRINHFLIEYTKEFILHLMNEEEIDNLIERELNIYCINDLNYSYHKPVLVDEYSHDDFLEILEHYISRSYHNVILRPYDIDINEIFNKPRRVKLNKIVSLAVDYWLTRAKYIPKLNRADLEMHIEAGYLWGYLEMDEDLRSIRIISDTMIDEVSKTLPKEEQDEPDKANKVMDTYSVKSIIRLYSNHFRYNISDIKKAIKENMNIEDMNIDKKIRLSGRHFQEKIFSSQNGKSQLVERSTYKQHEQYYNDLINNILEDDFKVLNIRSVEYSQNFQLIKYICKSVNSDYTKNERIYLLRLMTLVLCISEVSSRKEYVDYIIAQYRKKCLNEEDILEEIFEIEYIGIYMIQRYIHELLKKLSEINYDIEYIFKSRLSLLKEKKLCSFNNNYKVDTKKNYGDFRITDYNSMHKYFYKLSKLMKSLSDDYDEKIVTFGKEYKKFLEDNMAKEIDYFKSNLRLMDNDLKKKTFKKLKEFLTQK